MKCPFGQHEVVRGVYITEERYINFAKKRYVDFRPQCQVCTACKNAVVYMYNLKKSRLREKVKECLTVSSVDSRSSEDSFDRLVSMPPKYMTLADLIHASSNRSRRKSTIDDNIISSSNHILDSALSKEHPELNNELGISNKRERHNVQKHKVHFKEKECDLETQKERLVSQSSNSNIVIETVQGAQSRIGTQGAPKTSSTSHIRTPQKPTSTTKRVLLNLNREIIETRDNSEQSDVRRSQEASTSKAPNTKPIETERTINIQSKPSPKPVKRHLVVYSDEDDVDERRNGENDKDRDWLTINQMNGSRLPHVQPVPKRRPFNHPDPRIMDIYLSGTIGG